MRVRLSRGPYTLHIRAELFSTRERRKIESITQSIVKWTRQISNYMFGRDGEKSVNNIYQEFSSLDNIESHRRTH